MLALSPTDPKYLLKGRTSVPGGASVLASPDSMAGALANHIRIGSLPQPSGVFSLTLREHCTALT